MPSDLLSFTVPALRIVAPPPAMDPTATAASIMDALQACGLAHVERYAAPVRDFAAGKALLLAGLQGRGKTHLLRCLGVPVQHAAEDLVAGYGLDGIREWFAAWDGKPVCLDDIGAEPIATSFGAKDELMRAVAEHRIARQKARTFATTNLVGKEARIRYGDPTLSRLIGLAECHTIVGDDMRIKRASAPRPDYDAVSELARIACRMEAQCSGARPCSPCMRHVAQSLRSVFGVLRREGDAETRSDAVSRGIETAWAEIDAAGAENARGETP